MLSSDVDLMRLTGPGSPPHPGRVSQVPRIVPVFHPLLDAMSPLQKRLHRSQVGEVPSTDFWVTPTGRTLPLGIRQSL